MKPILFRISVCLSVSAIILAVSCTKTTPPPPGGSGGPGTPNPSNGDFVSSIKQTVFGTSMTDSFTYDASNRLTSIVASNGGPTTTFTYSGNSTVPASYTVSAQSALNISIPAQSHQLWYDGQNRIIKDSLMSGGPQTDGTIINNIGQVTYWSYPNGNIAQQTVGKGGPSQGQVVDTFFLNNGNIASKHSWLIGAAGSKDTVLDSVQYTYNSIVNPNFHQAVASTWGPLLYNNSQFDFISGFAVNTSKTTSKDVAGVNVLNNQSSQTFSYTLDSKGRAATETITDPNAGTVDNITFTYF
jgi:hypothetical protein